MWKMGCLLLYPEKRFSTNDIMSSNPSKKIKLDFLHKNDGNDENEDWGNDLTAEEFDMLEIQATQACNQNQPVSYANHRTSHIQVNSVGPNDAIQVEDLTQLQYELEGRVKLLSHSLEKSAKELNEERLNREKIINDKLKQFHEKENNLQKEVDKLRSVLEFKEQEMKTVYNKLQVLKSQVPEKKNNCADSSMNKNFEDFIISSKANHSGNVNCKGIPAKKSHRRYKLLVDTPRGNPESIDILSSILCSRLEASSFATSENLLNLSHGEVTLRHFTPVSIVQLKNEQKSDELVEYYNSILSNHVVQLKTFASRSSAGCSSKTSHLSAKWKETSCFSSQTIISCLRDTVCLLTCLKLDSDAPDCGVIKKSTLSMSRNQLSENAGESFLSQHSEHAENGNKAGSDMTSKENLSRILRTLIALVNPNTFPKEYSKAEEIELSLSALLAFSSSYPDIFLECVSELPSQSLLKPQASVSSVCITLKLITSLSGCQKFAIHLTHKDSNCLMCLIADFLCNTIPQHPENFSFPMILIEDFLSSVLSIHILESKMEKLCISEVIKGIITCLWKYFQKKELNNAGKIIVKKGCILLHLISSCIPNFKERRSQVEDEYISFVSSLLTLSKENTEFRELYDLIHNLWDFQTDVSEFDLDEPIDETQTSSNETDITD